jgi:Arc/MetJ-type ribon-helix-helix transcriptional regulator
VDRSEAIRGDLQVLREDQRARRSGTRRIPRQAAQLLASSKPAQWSARSEAARSGAAAIRPEQTGRTIKVRRVLRCGARRSPRDDGTSSCSPFDTPRRRTGGGRPHCGPVRSWGLTRSP